MKYRKLGRTGFDVSEIAYGVWGMSSWSGSDDRQSRASLSYLRIWAVISSILHGLTVKARETPS